MTAHETAVRAVATEFERHAPAWWTDSSGDLLARVAVDTLARLGWQAPKPKEPVR